jgi:hypothetical protein
MTKVIIGAADSHKILCLRELNILTPSTDLQYVQSVMISAY